MKICGGTLHFEFFSVGYPPSVNKASTLKKDTWKAVLWAGCSGAIAGGLQSLNPLPYPDKATIKVFFFPTTGKYFDLDNGLKYTLDGINHRTAVADAARLGIVPVPDTVVEDDRNFARIDAERIILKPGAVFSARISSAPLLMSTYAAAVLASAGTPKPYGVAIKVETYNEAIGPIW